MKNRVLLSLIFLSLAACASTEPSTRGVAGAGARSSTGRAEASGSRPRCQPAVDLLEREARCATDSL